MNETAAARFEKPAKPPMGICPRCRITCPLASEHAPNRCLDKNCPKLIPIEEADR
jgi:hypothetical protein